MLKKHTKLTRILIAAILCCLVFGLTGCGMLTPGSDICRENDEGNGLVTMQGDELLPFNFITLTTFNPARVNIGNAVNIKIPMFRDLAVILYKSLFPNQWEATDFESSWVKNVDGVNLDPAHVAKETMDKTGDFLSDDLNTLTTAIKSAAITILIAVWLIGFLQQMINEKWSPETLLKTLMQLICGLIFIQNIDLVINAFVQLGEGFMDAITLEQSEAATQYQDFNQYLLSLMTSIAAIPMGISIFAIQIPIGAIYVDLMVIWALILMILPAFFQLQCVYKIISAIIMRTIELHVRMSFAPLPIAFGLQQGFSQESISYIRKTLSCAMQPVLILLGCALAGGIANIVSQVLNLNQASPFGAIVMCITSLCLSAYLGETKQLAQDIIAR